MGTAGPMGPAGPAGAAGPMGPAGPAGADAVNSASPVNFVNSQPLVITHELSEDAEEQLTKTMNYLEFIIKKSQK
jgi:hypothetical protein